MNSPLRHRIVGPLHDLGDGIVVRRILPSPERLAVGPFVLIDHLGPLELPAGKAFDVRPHPHIGLSTLTYLWEGRIEHCDGLGSRQLIEPGAVNLMSAGSGIVHSERTARQDRGRPQRMHGLQIWLVPPDAEQQAPPTFIHVAAQALPDLAISGAVGNPVLKLVAGTAYGARSPVPVQGELFYVDARLPAGAMVALPDEHRQRGIYVVAGAVTVGEAAIPAIVAGQLALFEPGTPVRLAADTDTHLVMLGGAPLDSPRHIWWNYASSEPERIERAKRDWQAQRWPMVAGDVEFIPLPAAHERVTVTVSGDW